MRFIAKHGIKRAEFECFVNIHFFSSPYRMENLPGNLFSINLVKEKKKRTRKKFPPFLTFYMCRCLYNRMANICGRFTCNKFRIFILFWYIFQVLRLIFTAYNLCPPYTFKLQHFATITKIILYWLNENLKFIVFGRERNFFKTINSLSSLA